MRVDDHARVPVTDATAAQGAAARGLPAWVRAAARRRPTAEQLAVLLLALAVLAVHDVGYMLRQPFWTDEAWVAITTRFPLSQLSATTSSTPIGWSALLRVFTVSGTQTSRLVPLAFAGAAVVTAYWFARRIGWRWEAASVAAGLVAGFGVLLVPAMLVRDDLKQYTAEAFTALLVLALTSRLEHEWSRWRLAALSAAVWGGLLFSHAVALVGIAAFAAVCFVQFTRRAWRRLVEAGVAGVGTGALMLGVYKAFDARAAMALSDSSYWSHFYLPAADGMRASVTFVVAHFRAVETYFGLGPVWLAAPLVIAGLLSLARLGRPATALAAAMLWPEMLALSALRKYPFLDLRTSTFLITVTVVITAIGLIGLCSLLRSWLKGGAALGLGALAVAAFTVGAGPYLRTHPIPKEDVRDQARYVATHAGPGDVILVNLSSNWGFAYYWPLGQPSRRADSVVRQDYEAYFPGQPRIVVARNRDPAGVDTALSQALALVQHRPCARIWLIRTHLIAAERAAWTAALRQQGQSSERVGDHGLRVVRASGAGLSCR